MAGLALTLRRTILSPHSRALVHLSHSPPNSVPAPQLNPRFQIPQIPTRSFSSDLRKQAFEGKLLRLLRDEIDRELERAPLDQLPTEVNGFKVDECPGQQWFRLTKKFGDIEEIKLEVTMFDGEVLRSNQQDGDKTAEVEKEVVIDKLLHITLLVSISRADNDKVLEFICSAWPEEVEINNIYMHPRDHLPNKPYMGPPFKNLEDEMQVLLYEFLEARGINDDLSRFLHEYVKGKIRAENVRWINRAISILK